MKIFISWSGPKSGAVAKGLRDWLPMVVNAFDPFLSSNDIDKGTRWNTEIAQELEKAKAGIICLTAANVHSDWLLFEAGALSKKVEQSFVCPLLIDLKPSDVVGPLAQFQATTLEKPEVLKLLKTLNLAGKEPILPEAHLEKAFDKWWLDLENILKTLPSDAAAPKKPERSDRAILEEILELVREQNRPISALRESLWSDVLSQVRFERDKRTLATDVKSRVSLMTINDVIKTVVTENAARRKLPGAAEVTIVEAGPGFVTAKVSLNNTMWSLKIPGNATVDEVVALANAAFVRAHG